MQFASRPPLPSKSKGWVLPLSILVIGSLALAVVVLAKPEPKARPEAGTAPLVKVGVIPAQKETLSLAVVSQGTVTPKHEINLVAEVAGRIIEVGPNFIEGGFIQQGEVLATVDDREYQVAVLSAKARLADAKRRLAEEQGLARQAKREWRDLGTQSANDLFMRKPQLAAAQANVASAEADVSRAELDIERTKILAPFDGRLRSVNVDRGGFVSRGMMLAEAYNTQTVEVRLPLTDDEAALVDLPLSLAASSARVASRVFPQVTFAGIVAGTPYEWQGMITRTEAFIDSNSRLYYAIAEIATDTPQNRDKPILPGLFVTATIQGKALKDVMKLPRSALLNRDELMLLDADNKTAVQTVDVLQKDEQHIWVKGAIESGTHILIEKQSLLPEDSEVEPVDHSAIAAGKASSSIQAEPKPALKSSQIKASQIKASQIKASQIKSTQIKDTQQNKLSAQEG